MSTACDRCSVGVSLERTKAERDEARQERDVHCAAAVRATKRFDAMVDRLRELGFHLLADDVIRRYP